VARRLTFTVDREPIEVEIGGEVFIAQPVLSPPLLADLVDMQNDISELDLANQREKERVDKALDLIANVFDLVLTPPSAERFRVRMFSRDEPLDLVREVLPAIPALVREYTGRPTQPSSPSSNGSTTTGTPSTDGAPAEVSTPSWISPLAGSST
jgi:hypothetical protein